MKKTLFALAIVASTSAAHAGSMAEPIIEAPAIVADASSSSNPDGMLFGLLVASILWAALD